MGIKLPILRSTVIRGEILSPGEKIEISLLLLFSDLGS